MPASCATWTLGCIELLKRCLDLPHPLSRPDQGHASRWYRFQAAPTQNWGHSRARKGGRVLRQGGLIFVHFNHCICLAHVVAHASQKLRAEIHSHGACTGAAHWPSWCGRPQRHRPARRNRHHSHSPKWARSRRTLSFSICRTGRPGHIPPMSSDCRNVVRRGHGRSQGRVAGMDADQG
jgi:hypothetical protein